MLTRTEILNLAADIYSNVDYSTELSMVIGGLAHCCIKQLDVIEEQNKTIANLNEALNNA